MVKKNPKFLTNFLSSQRDNFVLIGNFSLFEEQNKEHKKTLFMESFYLTAKNTMSMLLPHNVSATVSP